MDSHPAAFGLKNNKGPLLGLLVAVHSQMVTKANAVMVTNDRVARQVKRLGGRPLVFHEVATSRTLAKQQPRDSYVLYVGVFASDEPFELVRQAARLSPNVHVKVTGDPDKAGPGCLDNLPSNIELVGYLEQSSYIKTLLEARLVLVLTTDEDSVPRSAFEAIFSGVDLAVSRTETTEAIFPEETLVENDAMAIAHVLREDNHLSGNRDKLLADRSSLYVGKSAEQVEILSRVLSDEEFRPGWS